MTYFHYICAKDNLMKTSKMRKFTLLLSIATLAMTLLAMSCEQQNEQPKPEQPQDTNFIFGNCITTNTSFTLDIVPQNKDWEYILLLSGVDYFKNNNIDNEQQLFEDDYLYFTELAEKYTEYELTMRELLLATGFLTSGEKIGYECVNLYPDTTYCLYCYAVEFDGDYYSPITPISSTIITTSAPELKEVTFETNTTVNGNIATLNIAPQNYSGYYYHYTVAADDDSYVAQGEELDEATIAIYRNRAMREFNQYINNEGKAKESFCHKGNVVIEERLQPNTSYMTLIFAVSDDALPIMSSMPQREYFETGDTKFSDLVLNIEINDIGAYSAQLHITPSTEDEYACVMLAANQLPQIDDEVELMNVLIDQFMPATFVGELDEALTPLMPQTEYVVLAFGIDETLPTSHLFEKRFTTAAQETGETYIEDIRVTKIFDVAEIAAIEPKYAPLVEEAQCLVLVEAVTNRPCDSVYFFWYESWMMYEYSKEAFVEDLLLYKPTPSPTLMTLWYSPDEYFFAGMAEDENGNFSDVYFGEPVPILYEDRSPAEEFFTLGVDIYVPEYNF